MADYDKPDKFVIIFSKLLSEVSVPLNEDDYFTGRVVEALPYEGLKTANTLLNSTGHLSHNYEKVLKYGLKGIVSEINDPAKKRTRNAIVEYNQFMQEVAIKISVNLGYNYDMNF